MHIKKTHLIIAAIVLLAVGYGVGAFFSSGSASSTTSSTTANRSAYSGTSRARGGAVNGQIVSQDAQSITVANKSGGSSIIFYDTTTTITKSTHGQASDLSVGSNVVVSGSSNSDGSITAQNINILPANASSTMPFGSNQPQPNQ
jgi:Domain of unknown function (DUF5666)